MKEEKGDDKSEPTQKNARFFKRKQTYHSAQYLDP
jgi:hypothetical protein